MTRLIVNNQSDLDMETALELCKGVVGRGRVSGGGDSYCYLTVFTVDDQKYQVAADRNKASDTLTILGKGGDDE